jgi:MFS superfamily sulfate permease-like transporter
MPAGAGYSGTAANEAAGATSRLAGLFAALVLMLAMITVLPYIALTPDPVLAAIVIRALGRALSLAPLRRYFAWRRDRVLSICAVLCVLLLGVLDGLLVAIAISLMLLLREMSVATIQVLGRMGSGHDFVELQRNPQAQAIPRLLILRPAEPLFFANAERILSAAQRLIRQQEPAIDGVILSLEETPDLDGTSLEALQDFIASVSGGAKGLLFARLKADAQSALLALPEPVLAQVILSDLSVDEAVRQLTSRASGHQADERPRLPSA